VLTVIQHPRPNKICVTHEMLVICDNDFVKAAILERFKLVSEENSKMSMRCTITALSYDLLGIASTQTISKCIDWLTERQFLFVEKLSRKQGMNVFFNSKAVSQAIDGIK